jgi:hypothetical protein
MEGMFDTAEKYRKQMEAMVPNVDADYVNNTDCAGCQWKGR